MSHRRIVSSIRIFSDQTEVNRLKKEFALTNPVDIDAAEMINQQLPFFSSKRERKLWVWTLVVVVTIYLTLGLASQLAQALYNQGVSAVILLVCMALTGLTVLTQALRARPRGIEIGIGIGILAVYIMVLLRLTMPERSHLIEYSVVAVFIYEALTERAANGRRIRVPALLAILATSLIGAIDEFIQLFLSNRHFDWNDVLFNSLASVMAVISMMFLSWAGKLAKRLVQKANPKKSDTDVNENFLEKE